MEQRDLEIIQQHVTQDKKLAHLYREHLDFERELEKFNKLIHLTAGDEFEKKELQKKKLKGRDEIENILSQYRTIDSAN